MVTNYEIIGPVKRSIKNYLARQVKGSIDFVYESDTLYIGITSNYGTRYVYTEYNVLAQVIDGLDGEMIGRRALIQYRKWINFRFFK